VPRRLLPALPLNFASLGLAASLLAFASAASAYEKATDTNEVVLNKLFPKEKRVELDGRFGIVLNSSYTQTFLANAGITYFWSEEWGFNVDGNFAVTSDKNERKCIETFYNDPNFQVANECGGSSDDLAEDKDGDANFGPAYVPIRQLKYMFTGNFIWNPIYGKQIVLLSATNYFDFFIGMGGGVAMSDFYPMRKQFGDEAGDDSGKDQRGKFCVKKQADAGKCQDAAENPGTDDEELIGDVGRPIAEQQTNLVAHFSIGQRFHFFRRFNVNAGLENYTLLGTESGFDNFFTLMGGFGVRF
jgi:outer membrane beta-barrel protein